MKAENHLSYKMWVYEMYREIIRDIMIEAIETKAVSHET
tara:strand:+ start:424 stop:540 length:117 start_codon:yes stop_codon:yes gene_type:complete